MSSVIFTVAEEMEINHGEIWKDVFSRAFPERAAMLKSEIFDDAVNEAAKQGWILNMVVFEDGEQ